MEKTKRVLAILMAVLMVATAFPMSVFAVDANTPVALSGTTFKQGDAVNAEFYTGGTNKEWIGLYYSDQLPSDSVPSISWAYTAAGVLASGADIASYDVWKSIPEGSGGINDEGPFYYQAADESWHLLPGKYKLIYFLDGGYTYLENTVVYFDVTDDSGNAPEADYNPSLSVNKTTFCVGEDIKVAAGGDGWDWVGLHLKGDVPVDGNSYYWYYVKGDSGNGVSSVPGLEYVIQNKVAGEGSDGAFDASKPIPAGDYVIRYFAGGGYDDISFEQEIKIVEHPEVTATTIDKASFKNEGAINGVCSVCGAETVKEVLGLATLELEQDVYEYTGSEVKAKVIVKDAKGNVLTEGTDYKLSYKQNVEISTDEVYAVVTATFLESNEYYQGSKSLKYNIIKQHEHSFT